MRFQSNVLNKNKHEKWIILFLTLTFIIDIASSYFLDDLEGMYFVLYRLSGLIAFSLILINQVAKYKQTKKKSILLSIAFFGLVFLVILVSSLQALV